MLRSTPGHIQLSMDNVDTVGDVWFDNDEVLEVEELDVTAEEEEVDGALELLVETELETGGAVVDDETAVETELLELGVEDVLVVVVLLLGRVTT